MQKPSEHHKLTSDNNIIKFKKPVHYPFKGGLTDSRICEISFQVINSIWFTFSHDSFRLQMTMSPKREVT